VNTKLIVALDVDSLKKAKGLVKKLAPTVEIFKVGSQLFTICGSDIIKVIHKAGRKVFLDLKFHDIPNTVANAAKAATGLGVFMFDVHARGGIQMMRAAAAATKKEARKLKITKPKLIGITVLTSDKESEFTKNKVLKLARTAKFCGLDGIVCSVHEAKVIRRALGPKFSIITPGIRPKDRAVGDQKRVATPKAAKCASANFIVVGRPIIQSKNPTLMAKQILKDLRN